MPVEDPSARIRPQPVRAPALALDAQAEDAHWRHSYRQEPYVCAELDYEDYAPAYCVGYVGCAQYGGRYDDAETSLCANWVRIKGDSRLPLDEARPAIRAAWERVAARAVPVRERRSPCAVVPEAGVPLSGTASAPGEPATALA